MKCICGSLARMIEMQIGDHSEKDKLVGYLLCCTSLEIKGVPKNKQCGLNSNWQSTKKLARKAFEKAKIAFIKQLKENAGKGAE